MRHLWLCILVSAFLQSHLSHAGDSIPMSDAKRVLIFSPNYHALTNMGEIVVCRFPSTSSSGTGCVDRDKKLAWVRLSDVVLPGFQAVTIQYDMVTADRAVLRVYYR